MKWTTVASSGILAIIMASQVAMAEGSAVQEQTESMEQRQLRLEQRFQNRSSEGDGMQYRYEERMRHRSGGDDGKQSRYVQQMQQHSSAGGQGGGARR
jgi:hypothetical protein